MQNKKVVVIICALIALCAVMYLAVPSSQNTGEAPKTELSKLPKQRVKNTREQPKTATARPSKQRITNRTQDNQTTAAEEQPRDIVRSISRPTPMTSDEGASPKTQEQKIQEQKEQEQKTPEQKAQELEKRIQDFKDKYEWDEPETRNIAEHLLNIIPEQFRDSGVTAMMKNLDEAQQQGGPGSVNELMLLQSAEKMMPEKFKPQLQEIIEKYKAEHGGRR